MAGLNEYFDTVLGAVKHGAEGFIGYKRAALAVRVIGAAQAGRIFAVY
jgi:hypothetical protein